jgi:hypothetical protein
VSSSSPKLVASTSRGLAAPYVELQVVAPRDESVEGHVTPERTTRSPSLSEDPFSDKGLILPWMIAKAIRFLAGIFGR